MSSSATQRAGIGSTRPGSGLRTSSPSPWLRFKPGQAWSALLQHLSRGFDFKAVHRATPPASSSTGFSVCSSTKPQPGSSLCCTPPSPQRLLQLGGAIRPHGHQALSPQGRPALQLPHPKHTHPTPLPPVKANPSFKRSANGRPPGPVCGALHSPQTGLGVLPSSPA